LSKIFLWAGFAVAVLAAAWLLITPRFVSDGDTPIIQINATNPWLIGDKDDAFSYAGKSAVIIQGEAAVRIDPTADTGTVEFILQPGANLDSRLDGEIAETSVALRLQLQNADSFWTDLAINKGSNVGDARLPMTHALYASSGRVELVIDGHDRPTTWTGFWFIGDALRQIDGSVRNQGLVFSPLLRDPSIFSDPSRRELTLLVYESSDSNIVVLHLVFPNVQLLEI